MSAKLRQLYEPTYMNQEAQNNRFWWMGECRVSYGFVTIVKIHKAVRDKRGMLMFHATVVGVSDFILEHGYEIFVRNFFQTTI